MEIVKFKKFTKHLQLNVNNCLNVILKNFSHLFILKKTRPVFLIVLIFLCSKKKITCSFIKINIIHL